MEKTAGRRIVLIIVIIMVIVIMGNVIVMRGIQGNSANIVIFYILIL